MPGWNVNEYSLLGFLLLGGACHSSQHMQQQIMVITHSHMEWRELVKVPIFFFIERNPGHTGPWWCPVPGLQCNVGRTELICSNKKSTMYISLFIKLVGICILMYCHVDDIKIKSRYDVYNLYEYFGNYLCTMHVTSTLLKVVEMRSQTSLVVYFLE